MDVPPERPCADVRELQAILREYRAGHAREHALEEAATTSSERAMDIRLGHLNEFRGQLTDQAAGFATKADVEALRTALEVERRARANFEGRMQAIIGVLALFTALGPLAVAILK